MRTYLVDVKMEINDPRVVLLGFNVTNNFFPFSSKYWRSLIPVLMEWKTRGWRLLTTYHLISMWKIRGFRPKYACAY